MLEAVLELKHSEQTTEPKWEDNPTDDQGLGVFRSGSSHHWRLGHKWGNYMWMLNLAWIHQIGGDIRPLEYLYPSALSFPKNVIAFNNAKGSLESFANADTQQESVLPKSAEKAKLFAAKIDGLLRRASATKGTRQVDILSVPMIADLSNTVKDFEKTLIEELGHIYAYAITDQRIISVKVMLETPDTMFASASWAAMSNLAKTEALNGARCLAFECYTASGFHFLRAVEATIRQYLLAAKTKPQKRDWGYYGVALKESGADPKVLTVVDQVRQTERNPLMHPEDESDKDQAIDLLNLCTTAINRLVGDMPK